MEGPSLMSARSFKFFQNSSKQGRIALGEQVFDPARGEFELGQTLADLFPESVELLALGEVEFGHQLGQPLLLDGVEVAIVALNNSTLVGRVIGHGRAPLSLSSGP